MEGFPLRKRLGDDEWHQVFGFLDMAGHLAVAGVCRRWANIVAPLLRREYLSIPLDCRRPVPTGQWKETLVSRIIASCGSV